MNSKELRSYWLQDKEMVTRVLVVASKRFVRDRKFIWEGVVKGKQNGEDQGLLGKYMSRHILIPQKNPALRELLLTTVLFISSKTNNIVMFQAKKSDNANTLHWVTA